MCDYFSSPIHGYYVEMPHNPTIPTNNHEIYQLVVNQKMNHELADLTILSHIQGTKILSNMLLLILPSRKKYVKEPLVD